MRLGLLMGRMALDCTFSSYLDLFRSICERDSEFRFARERLCSNEELVSTPDLSLSFVISAHAVIPTFAYFFNSVFSFQIIQGG